MRSTVAGPFRKIAHRPYLVNVNRHILFAHLKITGGTQARSFPAPLPEKQPLRTIFFHQTNLLGRLCMPSLFEHQINQNII